MRAKEILIEYVTFDKISIFRCFISMNDNKFAVKSRNSTKVVFIKNHVDIYKGIQKFYQGNI